MRKFIVFDSSGHEWIINADKSDVNSLGILLFVKDGLLTTVFNADTWAVCKLWDNSSADSD